MTPESQRLVQVLREALVYIYEHHGEFHIDDDGGDVDQDPECWCARCVACRALEEIAEIKPCAPSTALLAPSVLL